MTDPTPDELLHRAVACHGAGRRDEAERLYRAVLRLRPDSPDAHNNLGLLLRDLGRPAEAEACHRAALARRPDFAAAHCNLGLLLRSLGRWEEAAASCRRAVAAAPGLAEAHNALGLALRGLGRLREAEASCRRAVELRPGSADACNNLGSLLRELGRPAEAEAAWRRALALRPDFAGAWTNLGLLLGELGRDAEGEAACRRAVALRPDLAAAHSTLGDLLHRRGRAEAAAAAWRRALELAPGLARAAGNLGALAIEEGRPEEAEAWLERALTLDPDLADGHGNLGNLRFEQGRLEEAEASLRRAIALLRAQWEGREAPHPAPPRPVPNAAAAERALDDARDLLSAAGIPFFLCCGTLLGVIRDGALLPHDKDLDLGLPWEVERQPLLAAIRRDGRFLHPGGERRTAEELALNIGLLHRAGGVSLDLFFFRPEGEHFVVGLHRRPVPITSRPHRFAIGGRDWRGTPWPVPEPAERYLADLYGEGWRTPDPAFDTILSNRCASPESLPGRRLYGYYRLFQALRERRWGKAEGYGRQLLRLRPDPFIEALLPWLGRMAGEG